MLSRTLALLVRSLRAEARLMRTHLFRMIFVVFIALNLIMAHTISSVVGAPGLRLFTMISYLNFLFISMAGISFFATAITEEKEEDTLGLFKMAGVRPMGILLGKSTSRLVSAVLLLLVQLPFTLLAITLGGVTREQVIDAYCALSAYLVLLANAGLLCSVYCKRSQQACGLMTLLLLGFFIGPPIVRESLQLLVNNGVLASSFWTEGIIDLCRWVSATSVLNRLERTMSTGFNQSIFSVQFIGNLAASAVCFLLAWALFDRCTRDLAASTTPVRGLMTGSGKRFRLMNGGRVWSNALVWKDFHFVAGGKFVLLVKFLVYGGIGVTIVQLFDSNGGYRQRLEAYGSTFIGISCVVLMVELSLFSARVFHAEIKWNTLSSLMMLPASTTKVVWSKLAGCLLALAPACFYLIIGLCLESDASSSLARAVSSGWFWFTMLYFLLFLHVTAYLSLYLKWGALPLAFVGMIMVTITGQILLAIFLSVLRAPFLGRSSWDETLFVSGLNIVLSFCLVVLEIRIAARLRAVAAQ